MPLITPQEVESYLSTIASLPHLSVPLSSYDTVTLLTGGSANFVYRLSSSSPSSLPSSAPKTLMLKHAAPYVKSNASIPFPAERLGFERKALENVPPVLNDSGEDDGAGQASISVRLAKVYHFDAEASALVTEDFNPTMSGWTLKDLVVACYSISTTPDIIFPTVSTTGSPASLKTLSPRILDIATQLGIYLANLHWSTRGKGDGIIGDNVPAKNIYRYSYSNLITSLTAYGVPDAQEIANEVNQTWGGKLATDGTDGEELCVCHGDFWPGNVLVSSDEEVEKGVKLGIVDWEMTRLSTGATDVAQFAAEAWLLDRFYPLTPSSSLSDGVLSAFLTSYVKAAKASERNWIDDAFRQRLIIHFGTHLAFWPSRVGWGSKEQTEEVVKFGAEVLRKGLRGSWKWFQERGILSALWE